MIKKIILNSLISIVFIFLLLTLLLTLFNIKPHVVDGDSMHPTVKRYSLVYIKHFNSVNNNLNEDDIVLINANVPFIHRIIDIKEENNITYYETKGDNKSNSSDGYYEANKIIGIYKFHIPLIGLLFASKTIQIVLLAIVIFLVSLKIFIEVLKK